MSLTEADVYNLLGEAGFRDLVAAFYRRVPTDEILGPMYPPQDLAGAEQRLGGFLIQRFGGPDHYSRERGHPRLRMRHAPFKVDPNAREHWTKLMAAAMDEVALRQDVRTIFEKYFADTATFMVNHPG